MNDNCESCIDMLETNIRLTQQNHRLLGDIHALLEIIDKRQLKLSRPPEYYRQHFELVGKPLATTGSHGNQI